MEGEIEEDGLYVKYNECMYVTIKKRESQRCSCESGAG